MAEPQQSDDAGAPSRRRLWWLVGVALAAGVVIVLVVAIGATRGSAPQAGSTVSPTHSATGGSTNPPASDQPTPPAPGEPTPPAQAPPIGFDDEAEVVPGVRFTISQLEAVEGTAEGRGEIAGPALRFRVDVANDTAESVPLDTTVVNVYVGEAQSPAEDLSGPGVEPFPAAVAAGGTASGVFVFNVPVEDRDLVSIAVDYAVGVPIVVFQGAAPR